MFFGVVLLVTGSIHWYLWRRLVKDTTRPGRWRRIGTIALFVMLAALIGAFAMPRVIGAKEAFAFSLIGYIWLAVMFYLLVVLLALEIPRLLLRLIGRRTVTVQAAAGTIPAGGADSASGRAAEAATAARGASTAAAHGDAVETAGGGVMVTDGSGTAGRNEATVLDGGGAGVDGRAVDSGDVVGTGPGGAAGRSGGAAAGGGAAVGAGGPAGRSGDAGADRAAVGAGGAAAGGGMAVGAGGAAAGGAGGGDDGVSRRLVLARGAAIFAGLTATGLVGYGVKTALGAPLLKRVQIPLAKLPRGLDGYRIALVSDIHLGPLTGLEHSRRIVDSINGMDADLVAIVGDLVDGSVAELGRDAEPLRGLRSRDGSYFVTGNHEYYSGVDEWVDELGRLGVNVLRNERVEIRGLDLAGVNDVAGAGFPGGDGGPDFAKALGDRDPAKPVVLLAHQPVQAHEAAKYKVDLQLSGHTHGGQMVPFNVVARLQQPVISGLGEVDGTKVYVTNGAGFWGPPVRVGAPPDITLVELRAG